MAEHKSFGSDNHAGAHEAVVNAVIAANTGDATAYGEDEWTRRATARLRELFRAGGDVFFVFNGSAANILGLSLLLRRHEAVICAESAHIHTDECGAAEQILGTKLLTVPAPDGKLTPEAIARHLRGRGDEHHAQPGAVAITQTTELGTCYTLKELREISEFCHANDLRLFIDGARLANAAAHLDCSLADLAEPADVLSFGGTKNGALGAEAVVVMRPELMTDARYLRKQQLQLASKMRFLSAQFLALLDDDLWRRSAAHANGMAQRLARGVENLPGVGLTYPVQSDAVFARLNPQHIEALQRDWYFYIWDEDASVVRWMTAFDTTESDVDQFVASIAEVTGSGVALPVRTSPGHPWRCLAGPGVAGPVLGARALGRSPCAPGLVPTPPLPGHCPAACHDGSCATPGRCLARCHPSPVLPGLCCPRPHLGLSTPPP